MHIVGFNEGGYAVLGADDRIPSIIAIVEDGELTAESYAHMAKNGVTYDEYGVPAVFPDILVYAAMADSLGGFIPDDVIWIDPLPDPDPLPDYETIDYGDWSYFSGGDVMLNTKWSQSAPYNMYAPIESGDHCVAGCVPIAIAQIMTYNAYELGVQPTNLQPAVFCMNVDLQPIYWPGVLSVLPEKGSFKGSDSGSVNAMATARLIREIGRAVLTDYGASSSSTKSKYVEGFFAENGYQGVAYVRYKDYRVANMLNERKPVYIDGYDRTVDIGHAWVIDGKMLQRRTHYYKNTQGQTVHTEYGWRNLLHCNFGWGGFCDGYYIQDIFDLSQGPEELGDNDGGHDDNTRPRYYVDKKIITYSSVR